MPKMTKVNFWLSSLERPGLSLSKKPQTKKKHLDIWKVEKKEGHQNMINL